MKQDFKRFIMVVYFIGPWYLFAYWVMNTKPDIYVWTILALILFWPWLIFGNILTIRLFPEFDNRKKNKKGVKKRKGD